jgi:hypothetical protein
MKITDGTTDLLSQPLRVVASAATASQDATPRITVTLAPR